MKTDREEERDDKVSEPFLKAKVDKIAPLVEHDGQIHRLENKVQTAAGELSKVYEKIKKDFHGNPAAVKLVRRLASGPTDKAYDFMRTFLPLAKRFDLIPGEDLVDMMGGAGGDAPAAPEADEDPTVSAADVAPVSGEKALPGETGDDPISRAKAHLQNGTKPPAPKGPDGDTDLVEAGEAVAEERAAENAEPVDSDPAPIEGETHAEMMMRKSGLTPKPRLTAVN